MRPHLFIAVLAVAASALTVPQTAAATPAVDAELVLQAVHAKDALGNALHYFDDALARRKREVTVPAVQAQTIESLGHRIYPPRNLYKIFTVAYTQAIPPATLTALQQWLSTVKGLKFRRALDQAYKASSHTRKAYFAKAGSSVLKGNRRNALKTYIKATTQEEFYAVFQVEMDYSVLRGLNGFAQPGGRDTPRYLKEKTAPHKSGYIDNGRNLAFTFDAYAFKDLHDDEIDDLSKFATSAVGQAHTKAMAQALVSTLDAAAATLEAQVIKGTK